MLRPWPWFGRLDLPGPPEFAFLYGFLCCSRSAPGPYTLVIVCSTRAPLCAPEISIACANGISSTGVTAAFCCPSRSLLQAPRQSIIFDLMPAAVREHNSVLAVAALAYFSGVHTSRRTLRSARARILQRASGWHPVHSRLRAPCSVPFRRDDPGRSLGSLLAACVFFAALAWLNCSAIEHWESAKITRPNLARRHRAGARRIRSGCLSLPGAAPDRRLARLPDRQAPSLLALLDRLRSRLTPLALRAAADLVLLTPLLLIAR